jgi:predicted amidohydrolase YtcJ
MEEAVAGYTSGAAYALHLEGSAGVVRPGFAADLAVLSSAVDLARPASLWPAGAVDLTIAAGAVVYEREGGGKR